MRSIQCFLKQYYIPDAFSRRFRQTISSIVILLFISTSHAAIRLDANWEQGVFNDYYFNISRNKYGVSIVDKTISGTPSCTGNKSLKAELIFGKGSVWSQLVLNMQPFNSFENGKEHWFGFAVYLPSSYVPDSNFEDLIWELHARPDSNDGELSRNAPVALRTKGNEWVISYIKDSNYITYKAGDTKKVYEERATKSLGPFKTNKWTTFVINTLYDYGPQGYLKVWKDGTLVVNKTNGIGFNDKKGPFVKMGIYKGIWDLSKTWGTATTVSSRTLFIDDFKVGDSNSSYNEVSPKCNATIEPGILNPPTGLKLEILR